MFSLSTTTMLSKEKAAANTAWHWLRSRTCQKEVDHNTGLSEGNQLQICPLGLLTKPFQRLGMAARQQRFTFWVFLLLDASNFRQFQHITILTLDMQTTQVFMRDRRSAIQHIFPFYATNIVQEKGKDQYSLALVTEQDLPEGSWSKHRTVLGTPILLCSQCLLPKLFLWLGKDRMTAEVWNQDFSSLRFIFIIRIYLASYIVHIFFTPPAFSWIVFPVGGDPYSSSAALPPFCLAESITSNLKWTVHACLVCFDAILSIRRISSIQWLCQQHWVMSSASTTTVSLSDWSWHRWVINKHGG